MDVQEVNGLRERSQTDRDYTQRHERRKEMNKRPLKEKRKTREEKGCKTFSHGKFLAIGANPNFGRRVGKSLALSPCALKSGRENSAFES